MSTNADAYRGAKHGKGFVDRSDRARLEVTGPDRAKFLHNLTTNDVKRLAAGHGVEAFVTSPQGKTLGFVSILAADDRLLVRTDPGGDARVTPHLQKYGVFDDVAIEDVSANTFEFHLVGPDAEGSLGAVVAAMPEPGELRHVRTDLGGSSVRIVRESPLGGSGFTVSGSKADAENVRAALWAVGGWVVIDGETAEALRVEAGTPAFGRDVSPDNLPQEVARDRKAINFVKGCYLGQETVARIDALGHVNKVLCALRIEGGEADVPGVGATIEADGKSVGVITSAAFSPSQNRPVALGYVRSAHARGGTTLRVATAGGQGLAAVVVDRPPDAG